MEWFMTLNFSNKADNLDNLNMLMNLQYMIGYFLLILDFCFLT